MGRKKLEFPETIVIAHGDAQPGDDPWLEVLHRGTEDADETTGEVAVYKRVSIGRVRVTKEYLTKPPHGWKP